jgi:tryptophan halogenase
MHICIIGTGVSGLMTACEVSKLNFVEKISIIGSSKIPSIKVGESTTEPFYKFVEKNFDISEFVKSTDASVKYGVYYNNWSEKNFIHFFGSNKPFIRKSTTERVYCEMLANKDPKIHIHDLIGIKLWKFIQKNEVSLNLKEHIYSWHFDAGKVKLFLKNHLKKDNKIKFFDDTIVDCKFYFEDHIEYIVGENNTKYIADYYVNCCGDNKINERVFKNEYISSSSYLLTNKALVYPLKYTNTRDQFHPYTVAKTMKNGWRWITPTQSRIGTGYVFSDDHISVDEATHEFLEDIGDKKIEPFLVDFNPRYNKKPFKLNNCTIGMSSEFLEPLDAPGLASTSAGIVNLIHFLKKSNEIEDKNVYVRQKEKIKLCKDINFTLHRGREWWCSFILHQYKTCWRNDTKFWIDHKNVKCDFYEAIINSMEYAPIELFEKYEYEMLFKTTAAKDIQWKSKLKYKPFPIEEIDTTTVHHLEYIQKFYD